jgi:hypothetical protein
MSSDFHDPAEGVAAAVVEAEVADEAITEEADMVDVMAVAATAVATLAPFIRRYQMTRVQSQVSHFRLNRQESLSHHHHQLSDYHHLPRHTSNQTTDNGGHRTGADLVLVGTDMRRGHGGWKQQRSRAFWRRYGLGHGELQRGGSRKEIMMPRQDTRRAMIWTPWRTHVAQERIGGC